MKIKFTAEDEYHTSTTIKEFEAVQLQDMLIEFEYFLRACGYGFSGNVGIIESNEETL